MVSKVRRIGEQNDIKLLAILVYLFMLFLNILTPYVADDFVYRISFYDKTTLDSLVDVAKSMYVHCFRMNGRVVSHSLEQIFMLMPKMIFNICNAGVFTLSGYVIYRIINFGNSKSVLLFGLVFVALWFFVPVFGQVMLWQVGALNYLWGLFACLLFLCPYILGYVSSGRLSLNRWKKALFCVGAFFVGMYIETSSFIAILLAGILWLAARVEKKKPESWLLFPLLIAAIGFIVMMTMPAEINAKHGTVTLEVLMQNIVTATQMLQTHLLPLVIAWFCFFSLAVAEKTARERIVLSGIFAFGAVAANYMPIVAAYYPERCMISTAILLILACGVLMPSLKQGTSGVIRICACSALLAVFLFSAVEGCYDIWQCHTSFAAREAVIQMEKDAGNTDLVLGCVHPQTEYSAFWGLRDLSTESADTWPNSSMAIYYGVNSVLGY